ncbi:tRNA1(Val) (adenine(37)-N6)-methyltransferase [Marinobacterium sp. YM272]|uniref:tRNA1(Val) (adenine(37)-N6)-methyltransferase n=1 Tax=Marinobacterium sp. YM272 TaxID=3421654 RepID=UPI003D7FA497
MSKRRRNSFFQCRNFRIEQQGAAMKVTTDACALAAWAPLASCGRILDIGTGSGVLALFLAQRAPQAQVDAVELNPEAAEQARRNFDTSPYAERLSLYTSDITAFQPQHRYDGIICNPPFFQDATHNSCHSRAQARHNVSLELPALLEAIARLLAAAGTAFILLPVPEALRVISLLDSLGLYLRHQLSLISQPGDAPHRLILGISPDKGQVIEETLTLYCKHPVHSTAAGELFHPFYTRLRCEDPRFESP